MLSGQQLRLHLPCLTRKSLLRRYMSFPFWHCTFVTPRQGHCHRPEQPNSAIDVSRWCCNGNLVPFRNSRSAFLGGRNIHHGDTESTEKNRIQFTPWSPCLRGDSLGPWDIRHTGITACP